MANSTLALGSSLNLKSINKSVNSLGESVRKAQSSSATISKSLLESNRDKRKSLALGSSLFRKRREATLRREREDILEAGKVTGIVRRTGKVVMNSTKGFLGRILDYVGTLLVGWAILNLPKIIKLATNLTERMQKYFRILQDFVGGVSNFFLGLPQRFGEILTSITNFGFDNLKTTFDGYLDSMQTIFKRMQLQVSRFIIKLQSLDTPEKILDHLDMSIKDFEIPGLDKLKEMLGVETEETETETSTTNQTGSAGPYPDPKSVEMYRIAAALTTEGNSDQGYADMMQVVANRVASPGYGNSYTEVLAAGTAANPQFAGVWNRGAAAFKSIRSLGEASAWSGQSQATLLKVISLMTDPARQASAASFVGGALEFRGSPATVREVNSDNNPKNNIQADRNGIIPGTVWRGTNQDNQFIISNPPGAQYIPIRPGGAAPLNLPSKAQKVSFNPATQPNAARATMLASTPMEEETTNLLVINRTTRVAQPVARVPQQIKNNNGFTMVNSNVLQDLIDLKLA